VDITREGEVGGSIPNNRVAREFYTKNTATCDLKNTLMGGWVLFLNNCFAVFKTRLMFLKMIFTSSFITSTASGIFTGGPQLPTCKNDDFY
jgi:hypothetical protein